VAIIARQALRRGIERQAFYCVGGPIIIISPFIGDQIQRSRAIPASPNLNQEIL
jgi:hypothetical protein